MKKIIVLILSFITILTVAQDQPTKAPEVKTFTTNTDLLGAISNSVNLFTGDVVLPLNLASLGGRGGLGANVGITYSSSSVHKVVDIWNLEAPTGILGLGWSMDYPKIIVDNKLTGTREDDDFYLVEGGTSNKLICTGYNSTDYTYSYAAKQYAFWKITYKESAEKWEIIKEDGTKYIYGDNATDNDRKTVQYLIKWENWIGNSSVADGQERQALVWNLSEIVNRWGEKIEYEYNNVEEKVGAGTLTYTKASYIKKIRDMFNRTVEFFYGEKTEGVEYKDPHTEQTTEPDAYQEMTGTKFLDYIELKDANSALLSSIYFGYSSIGTGDLYKRLLSSITQKNSLGVALPAIKFTYQQSGNPKGALSTITTPSGAVITYSYTSQAIVSSTGKGASPDRDRKMTITAPTNYHEPRVWIGNNYVVVTWRQKNDVGGHTLENRQVLLDVYEWDGGWTKAIDNMPIFGVRLENDNHYQDFNVVLENDFFAVTNFTIHRSFALGDYQQRLLYIFNRNETQRGVWNHTGPIDLNPDPGGYRPNYDFYCSTTLNVGNNFVVASINWGEKEADKESNKLRNQIQKVFVKQGNQWNESSGITTRAFITASNNFYIAHINGTSDVYLRYLDRLGTWNQKYKNYNFYNSVEKYSYWHSTNSFAMGLPGGDGELLFNWDENYNLSEKYSLGSYEDNSYVFLVNNTLATLVDHITKYLRAVRFGGGVFNDPTKWYNQPNISLHNAGHSSFTDDVLLHRTWTNYNATLKVFDPNSMTWSAGTTINSTTTSSYPAVLCGPNFLKVYNQIYFKKPEAWSRSGTLPIPSESGKTFRVSHGQGRIRTNFIMYDIEEYVTGGWNDLLNPYIQLIKNGELGKNFLLDGEVANYSSSVNHNYDVSELVGNDIFLTYGSLGSLENITEFILHKVINDDISGELIDYPVSYTSVNDGNATSYTAYKFETLTSSLYSNAIAIFDPTGTIAQYNKATVVPGSSTSTSTPYGYTSTYFFNGQPTSQLVDSPADDSYTNPGSYYSLLTGLPYKTEVYNSTGSLVSSTTNYYWVESKPVNTERAYYSRLKKTVNSIDGIETSSESTYDLNTGLVKTSKTYNRTPLGDDEILITEYKYFWEQYNTDRSLNLLTPVIQTIKKNNGTIIDASATIWTNSLWGLQSAQWVPYKTYRLIKSSTAQFNFASPTDDWQKISEVTSFDAAHGNVLETIDAENIYAAVKYGYQSTLPVAAIKNGRAGDINVVDLEEGIAAGWNGAGSITNDGHTGKKGYNGSLNATITTSGNYKYVVSGWVKADPQTTAPNLSASGVTKNYSGSGNWEYIELVVASSGSSVIPVFANNGGAACTWDDIRVYPAIASLTTTTYDPTTLQVTSTTNSNGVTAFNEYDTFGRLIRTLNDNGEVMSEQSSYLSREVNSTFTFSDPNVSESVNFLNGNLAKNWNYEDIEVQSGKVLPVNWLSNDFNNVEISYDNYLGRRGIKFKNGVGNSNYLFQKIGLISSGKTYTASVWFKALSGSEGKLFFGDAGAPYDYDNSKSVILPGNNGWQKLTVTHTMTHADEMYVSVYGTSGEVIYDGVIVEEGTTTSEPLVSKTYSDGLGRNLQTHTRNAEANKVSVSATGYDAIGRAYRNYKTYELNYPSAYDANYSTNAGLYSETEYYTDPLSRTKYSKPLGASSNAEWITTNYGSALISNKSYLYVQSESKIGANNNLIKTRTYSDLQGRTIRSAEVKFVGDEEVDFDYIVETKYNIYGQVESVKDPMGLASSYEYDFKGNKTKVTVPDKSTFDGTTSTPVPSEYVYDKTNKLRFMVTPEGRQQNHVLYWKYDNLGRIIEKGYFNGTWNGSTYQTYADSDPAYPTGITTWRNKYYYDEDIDGMHSTIRGRVYKILSNNDVDNSEEIEETFRYDKYGNVLEKSTRALDYSKTSYSANYEYNKAGNVLKNSCGIISTLLLSNKTEDDIVNPVVYEAADKIEAGTSYIVQNNSNVTLQAGKSIALKPGFHAQSGSKFKASVVSSLAEMNTETVVVYTYDSHGNLKTVGTTSNPSLYATYTYDKNGAVSYERLNNSSITNTYAYDNLNRLASINGGGNFSETLDYTNYYFGGIAKAAYNNGESYIHYYQYDDYGRLKSTDEGAPGSSSVNILNITYDKNGNIETLNDGTLKDYVYYPSTNKLRNTNGTASNNYTYDANGNMNFSASKTLSMIYDPFTQMTSSINSSSYNVGLQYTADNERLIKNETGTGYSDKTLYLRGMNEYPLVEKHADTAQPDNVYIYGANGLIAVKNSGKTYFVIKDHLGSTRAVIDGATNSPATRYNYLPFGGLKDIASNNITNYRFTGQETDELIGLYNFRARMYDPDLGIFLGIDPAGQGFAPFAYCGNNPVIRIDRDGRLFWMIPVAIGAVIGGYSGYQIGKANGAKGFDMFAYIIGGAVIGGASGYAGYAISTSGTMMANTSGLIASSFANSVGMSMLSGQNMAGINFGVGSLSFKTGKVDWAFGNKNNIGGYLSDIADFFGVISVVNDIYAAAFVPYKEVAEGENQALNAAKESGTEINMSDRLTSELPYSELEDNWKSVGKDLDYYAAQKNKIHFSEPPLGKFFNGANNSYRIGRIHVGDFFSKITNKFQSAIHADYFDINKNFLWHVLEWLITPTKPTKWAL